MNIDSSDIKHLRIFLAVVEANGISNAQSMLNKDASTISRAISALEVRLGLKLCIRGRQGFELTPEGKAVQEETIMLFSSMRAFQNRIESLGGNGVGRLAIGIIDNIITDANCPVQRAIARITNHFGENLHIDLHVKTPHELEKHLLDKRIDIALGIFERRHDAIQYQALYEETDYLYCASGNPVVDTIDQGASHEEVLATLRHQNFCARSFLNERDLMSLGFTLLGDVTYTTNLEAIALLVLSGKFVGFMPDHYARRHVDAGTLLPILPSCISRTSELLLAHRRGEEGTRQIIAKSLSLVKKS
ncbi:LysR family transcriptional regulator [Phytopseudomonas daroniae]|uniref:LysR family transcriptional regulator n=1 Tax=Phytopseudomonas daroniae TaxID=2487519 RepID=UPI0010383976|nr:LysR family transcriptional regulator [Pseudomonas daroniae]TBU75947.1 LysR family transcriptional regulator [Pseudomonas daroniae]